MNQDSSRASAPNLADVASPAWSRYHTAVFATTSVVVALVPWTVARWPSQDGPNHLAVVHVLMHAGEPTSPFARYLTVETGLRPSTGTYTLLALLARRVPLPTAERLLVSAALLLLPCSLLLFLRLGLPRRAGNALLALPFVLGWPVAMGFLGFVLAMAFGVGAVALAWRPPGSDSRPSWLPVLAGGSLLTAVWFHPVAAAIAGLGLLVLEGAAALRPSTWPRLLLAGGPAAVSLCGAYLAGHHPPPGQSGGETLFASPLALLGGAVESLVAYTPWELVPRGIALGAVVWFVVRGLRAFSLHGRTAEAAAGRLVLGLLVLYCVTPVALNGWFYASTRFLLFASVLLPAVADVPPHLARRVLIAAPTATGAILAMQWPNVRAASLQLQQVVEVGAAMPRGAKIIPMDFTTRLLGPQPLAHAWAELVLTRDAIASQLFAAGKPRMGGESFRTLAFRPGVLDEKGGSLPWSTAEGWSDVTRKCSPNRLVAWLDSSASGCEALLAERKATLDAVLDRYDYVLMLGPPAYARDLVASRASLAAHDGVAWLYQVERATTARGAPPP